MRRLPALVLVLASAACAGDGGKGRGTASITVHVIDGDGSGVSNVSVALHDEDGDVTGAVLRTDAAGVLEASLPEGGLVTVALEYDGDRGLETIARVEDGDELWFQRNRGPTGMTIQATFAGVVSGADLHGVHAGCVARASTSTAGTLDVEVPTECITSTIGAFAYEAGNPFQPLAFAIASPVGTGTVPVAFGAWRTDWQDVPVTVSGVPAGAGTVTASLGTYIDRRHFVLLPWQEGGAPAGGGAALTLKRVPSIGIAQYAGVTAAFGDGSVAIISRDETLPTSVAVDLSAALPRVTGVTVDWGDAARPTIAWSTEGEMDGADVLELTAAWEAGYWQVRTSPGESSPVRVPELPPELSDWLPDPSAAVDVEYEDLDYRDGYDEERNANRLQELPPESWTYRRSRGED